MINLLSLVEDKKTQPKALLMAGAPGSGKGHILNQLDLGEIEILNLDNIFIKYLKYYNVPLNLKDLNKDDRSKASKAMTYSSQKLKKEIIPNYIEKRKDFILDGTSSSFNQTSQLIQTLQSNNYNVMMLFVYTHLHQSLKQNNDRFDKSNGEDRSLIPSIVFKTWIDVTKNFFKYKKLLKDNFISISNSNIEDNNFNLNSIIAKHITPFRPTDSSPKPEKEEQKKKKEFEKNKQDALILMDDDFIQSVHNNSSSLEEIQNTIKNFMNE